MIKFFKFIFSKIKNLDKKIDTFKEKTGSSNLPSKAFLNWGIHLALEGRVDEALEKFEMSSNMPFTDPENYTNWGIALAKLHRFEEAIEKFDKALEIDMSYSSAYSLKGAALVELNRTDEAIECYNQAVKYAPYDPDIYINHGVALARTGQKAKAEQQFKKALSLSLTNVNAAFLLAVVLYEQDKLLEALERFNYVIKLSNTHAMAFYYLSLTHTKLKNYKSALECAIITVQLVPFKIDFLVNLAECYYDVKDLKMALKTYRNIKRLAPENYAYLISSGIFWQKLKKFAFSEKYLAKAITKPQADYLTNYYYAISLAGMGRLNEAKEVFGKIVEEKPDFYDALLKLAVVTKTCGENEKAIALFEDLFSKSAHFTQYFNQIANCYLQIGNVDKSIEYYKKMIEYYPEDTEAHLELAQIYLIHKKDIKNALRMIRTPYKNNPCGIKINTLYALILAEEKDFDGAIEKINQAINQDENNFETHMRKLFILKNSNYTSQFEDYLKYMKETFSDKTEIINSALNN